MDKRKKFLLDENLGRLAKWLRMLGYDTIVPKSISIDRKISLCIKERRIFLTRSKRIAKRREQFIRMMITEKSYKKQLYQLRELINFENELSTRCLECNNFLQPIDTKFINNIVPEMVLNNFSKFKICRKCGKIFWKGTHYQAMKRELNNLLTTIVNKF